MDNLQLLILKNQYEILSSLEPKNREYQNAITAIDSGFMLEIEQLIEQAVVEPVSVAVCKEVRNILDMFRNMQTSLRECEADEDLMEAILFPGFDGNEESAHYSYALYLLEDRGLWQGLENCEQTWNSHRPMLHTYRMMLDEYSRLKGFPYSEEDVARVLEAKLEY
ncbi:hypothetical protein D3C77_485880 [compost metagenome]|uniref:YfbU family protein n=1 Tax=Pseudomonas TaxID=286 RepID=UPI000F928DEF|nr:YfbU family protein [Pseudomonas sp. MYb187]